MDVGQDENGSKLGGETNVSVAFRIWATDDAWCQSASRLGSQALVASNP